MSDRPTIMSDMVTYCKMQELDYHKSNDFNKIYNYVKRTSRVELSVSNLLNSIDELDMLSGFCRETVKEYTEAHYHSLLMVIFSFVIRREGVDMAQKKMDGTKTVSSIRTMLCEDYSILEGQNFSYSNARERLKTNHLIEKMHLSFQDKLLICEKMFEQMMEVGAKIGLGNFRVEHPKKRMPITHDPSYVMLMVLADLGATPPLEEIMALYDLVIDQAKRVLPLIQSRPSAMYFSNSHLYFRTIIARLSGYTSRYINLHVATPSPHQEGLNEQLLSKAMDCLDAGLDILNTVSRYTTWETPIEGVHFTFRRLVGIVSEVEWIFNTSYSFSEKLKNLFQSRRGLHQDDRDLMERAVAILEQRRGDFYTTEEILSRVSNEAYVNTHVRPLLISAIAISRREPYLHSRVESMIMSAMKTIYAEKLARPASTSTLPRDCTSRVERELNSFSENAACTLLINAIGVMKCQQSY